MWTRPWLSLGMPGFVERRNFEMVDEEPEHLLDVELDAHGPELGVELELVPLALVVGLLLRISAGLECVLQDRLLGDRFTRRVAFLSSSLRSAGLNLNDRMRPPRTSEDSNTTTS